MRSKVALTLAVFGLALVLGGCSSQEKVDDQFTKAFDEQGARMRGQQVPEGATPPPTN